MADHVTNSILAELLETVPTVDQAARHSRIRTLQRSDSIGQSGLFVLWQRHLDLFTGPRPLSGDDESSEDEAEAVAYKKPRKSAVERAPKTKASDADESGRTTKRSKAAPLQSSRQPQSPEKPKKATHINAKRMRKSPPKERRIHAPTEKTIEDAYRLWSSLRNNQFQQMVEQQDMSRPLQCHVFLKHLSFVFNESEIAHSIKSLKNLLTSDSRGLNLSVFNIQMRKSVLSLYIRGEKEVCYELALAAPNLNTAFASLAEYISKTNVPSFEIERMLRTIEDTHVKDTVCLIFLKALIKHRGPRNFNTTKVYTYLTETDAKVVGTFLMRTPFVFWNHGVPAQHLLYFSE